MANYYWISRRINRIQQVAGNFSWACLVERVPSSLLLEYACLYAQWYLLRDDVNYRELITEHIEKIFERLAKESQA